MKLRYKNCFWKYYKIFPSEHYHKDSQPCSYFVLYYFLHLGIDLSVHLGERADISGVVEQDSVHGFRVALTRFDNSFVREKFTHGGISPFPPAVSARQSGYAALLCCVTGQYTCRSRAATDAESNSAGFLPVPAPVKQRSRCQRRRKATFILLLTDSAGFVLLPCSKHK